MRTDLLKGHVDLVLLSCLVEGPAHGYLIAKRLHARSEGEFELLEGTLYPALHRLEGSGLVASRWSTESGRRRRVYRLTSKGGDALAERAAEWDEFSRAVSLVLKGTG
jgi:PadR family transcriptional regulator PadR